ncbi:hypothetical protein Poli38472_013149 [Pythium oligandrum]|uniref:ERCC4 domain-containing protein n=1 Tax=Pythium oligandrum TaxID=41045 RepID=A0A8K1FDV8_PYTOL|nr:hypothetical protein Poli38472_013149 [Pythium oligandrum]|eukprot:TMW55258.1 hypothetical protein Poli38472_013149 [Pythium oligandrum]
MNVEELDDAAAWAAATALVRKRRRRVSTEGGEGDERTLDDMLTQLGIPTSDQRTSKRPRQPVGDGGVIELLTPPRPPRRTEQQEEKSEETTLDLTTPTPPRRNNGNKRESIVDLVSPEDEASPVTRRTPMERVALVSVFETMGEDDAMLDALLENQSLAARLASRRAARGDEPLARMGSSPPRLPNSSRVYESAVSGSHRPQARPPPSPVGSPIAAPKPTKKARKAPAKAKRTPVIAVVAMNSAFQTSPVGELTVKALQENVYNSKPVPFELAPSFASSSSLIQWERRGGNSSEDNDRFAIALHCLATDFLQDVVDNGYAVIRQRVESLSRSPLHIRGSSSATRVKWHSMVLVVEGMDRALIQHKKKAKKTTGAVVMTFSDLHELAFQLFMDTGIHTKFTCDQEATASYIAIFTREWIVAATKQGAQEEFLEAVPRLNSFRVMPSSGSTMNVHANAWVRMLQMIPSISEDRAQSILNHFPTFSSLRAVYSDPNRTDDDKAVVLADKLHGSRWEAALSKRIFNILSGQDPASSV